MNHLLLMMGGCGTRFGADRPKQYVLVNDKPLFSYILEKLNEVKILDSITIVSHFEWIEYVEKWCKQILKIPFNIVEGGDNRSQSVKRGLESLVSFANDDDVVMIHDATHPYVDGIGMEKIVEAVKKYGGATLGKRSYDTVYRIDKDGCINSVEPRELIYAGASPEAFVFKNIFKIYAESSDEELKQMTSAGALALSNGIPMKVIETDELNLKITYSNDLELFMRIL